MRTVGHFFFKSYIFFPYPIFLVAEFKKSLAVFKPEAGEKRQSPYVQTTFFKSKKEIFKFFIEVIFMALRPGLLEKE